MRNAASLSSRDVKERRVPVPTRTLRPTSCCSAVARAGGIGLVMVFSASSATAYAEHGDIAYYVKRQLVWLLVGRRGRLTV